MKALRLGSKWVLSFFLVSPVLGWSQTGSGAIQGTVKDLTAAVLPGADVKIVHTQTARAYGISSVAGPYGALVGVFLGPGPPDASRIPVDLDFIGATRDLPVVSPSLQQAFYIGRGKTRTDLTKTFVVPAGATRLFLGILDYGRDTSSGYNSNNTGFFTTTLTLVSAPAPTIFPSVYGTANITLAGATDGRSVGGDASPLSSPVQFPSLLTAGQVVQITATGFVDTDGGDPQTSADGNRFYTTQTARAYGISSVAGPYGALIGVLLGPNVLGIVTTAALGHLDVVISIALATLGVFIGIAAARESSAVRRLLAASSAEAIVTIAIVAGAILFLLDVWRVPLSLPATLVALSLGICASASAAPFVTPDDDGVRRMVARVADLDDVVPIVLGGAVLILVAGAERPALQFTAMTALLGAATGLGGLLLIDRTEDPAERGVFVLGSLALLGGTAAYLSLSPLLTGMSAGWLWSAAPGRVDRVIADELRKVQHPLVVLLLVPRLRRVAVALADSPFNADDLRALGYEDVRVAPLLVDLGLVLVGAEAATEVRLVK